MDSCDDHLARTANRVVDRAWNGIVLLRLSTAVEPCGEGGCTGTASWSVEPLRQAGLQRQG